MLGHWIKSHHTTYQLHKYFFSPLLNEIYRNNKIYHYERQSFDQFNISKTPSENNPIAVDTIPVDISNNSFRIRKHDFKPPTQLDSSTSFRNTVMKIPKWKKKLHQNIFTRYSTYPLTIIQQSKLFLIATDGSKSDRK